MKNFMETMTEFKRQNAELLKVARSVLEEMTNENLEFKIYPCSYDDKFSAKKISEVFYSYLQYEYKHELSFKDFLETSLYEDEDWYSVSNDYFYDCFKSDLRIKLRQEGIEYLLDEFLQEYGLCELIDSCGFNDIVFDVDSFFDGYKINLILATQREKNNDFYSLMDSMLDFLSGDNRYEPNRKRSCLTYLVRQQGYSIKELKNRKTPSKFVSSVQDELDNMYVDYGCNLTILSLINRYNYNEVLTSIARGNCNIRVEKLAALGLFDQYRGSGSILEIELEKDFIFPVEMIYDVQFEGGENNGYSVNEVYGLVGSCWQDNIEVIKR